jgi:L-aminopeptidase/D-esterase-like protein
MAPVQALTFACDNRRRRNNGGLTLQRGYGLLHAEAAVMKNLITDVPGVRVGNAHDAALASGVTAVIFDEPAVAAIDVRGGGPGTRESSLLDVANTVERIDALSLSGGSAFGLDAGSGIQAWLAEQGRGFAIRDARVPIVPGAVVFDLLNGGNKKWGRFAPYRDLGYAAAAAAGDSFALGTIGGGFGATTSTLKGGLGSASAKTKDGVTVGAIVIVNAVGTATIGEGPCFWAAPFEQDNEFGGRGFPPAFTPDMLAARLKGAPTATAVENTTIAVVATDAALTKAQARRLAIIAHTGLARAIYPVHAPLDGDAVFAVSTGTTPIDPLYGLTELGMLAANVMARAIARGVYEADPLPFAGALPSWKSRHG